MKVLNKMVEVKDKIQNKADKLYIGASVAMGTMLTPAFSAFADNTQKTSQNKNLDVSNAKDAVLGLINSLLGPLIAIVGALGTLYCVLLGVKYAKAEEPQEREKAKQHLKSAIIGFVLIFVLIVVLKLVMPSLVNWVNANASMNLKVD